jgi:hypothetical protein
MTRQLLVAFAIGLLASVVHAGPLEDGQAAYDVSDYVAAMQLWRLLAERGDAHTSPHSSRASFEVSTADACG